MGEIMDIPYRELETFLERIFKTDRNKNNNIKQQNIPVNTNTKLFTMLFRLFFPLSFPDLK
jgi:hypothetical protein